MKLKTKYSDCDAKLLVSKYQHNNQIAIKATSLDGEPLFTATVCVDEVIPEGQVVIKNWSENEGVKEALQEANVIGEEIRSIECGFCYATVHELLIKDKVVIE